MKRKNLFVSDLDGTLLDQRKAIPQNALDAINRYTQAGGIFTVATGRTEKTCCLATDLLPISAPVILYNGACIMDLQTHEVFYERTLSAGVFRPIVQHIMDRFPEVCIEIFSNRGLILVNPKARMDPYIVREKQDYVRMPLEETPDTWMKIMLSASNETLKKIADFRNHEIGDCLVCSMMFSAEYYYEILSADCSKAKAMQWLAEWMHIDKDDIGAIGDHLNDEELLSWCGHPYAPANAHERVKQIAYVTGKSNNNGAIEEALEHFEQIDLKKKISSFLNASKENCR